MVDEENVYWPADERVRCMPKDGGEIAVVATCRHPPSAIAVDGEYVYVADRHAGTVIAVPCEGGDDDDYTIAVGQHGTGALAVDDESVYWTTSEGALRCAPKDGGPVVTLAERPGPAGALVVDRTGVYWLRGSSPKAAILRVAKEGGEPSVLASGLRTSGFLAQDAGFIYWADPRKGAVMRVPKAGGAPAAVVEGLDAPEALVVDGANVYWSETGARYEGQIVRFPLK